MKPANVFLSLAIASMITAASAYAQSEIPSGPSFREEGIASWYGSEFDGRPTASGEIFDSTQFTAAHRGMAFGSFVIVTNTHNNRRVRVRINDRGPFVASRIIDVSRAAAEALDMIGTGTAPVLVEMSEVAAVGPLSPAPASAAPVPVEITAAEIPPPETTVLPQNTAPAPAAVSPVEEFQPAVLPQAASVTAVTAAASPGAASILPGGIPPAGTGKSYRLQVGAYRIPRNAVEAFEKLKGAGLNPAYEQNNDMYRVVLAGLKPEEIQSVAEKLMSAGFAEALLREER